MRKPTRCPSIPAPEGFYGCPGCKVVKPLSEFFRSKKKPRGHDAHCKGCRRAWRARDLARFSWDIDAKARARFQRKTAPGPNGCIEYTAMKDKDGYGLFYLNGRQLGAHRVAWAIAGNVVPDWPEVIDHRCKNVACVHVAHLRVVAQVDNTNKYADRSGVAAKITAYWAERRAANDALAETKSSGGND